MTPLAGCRSHESIIGHELRDFFFRLLAAALRATATDFSVQTRSASTSSGVTHLPFQALHPVRTLCRLALRLTEC